MAVFAADQTWINWATSNSTSTSTTQVWDQWLVGADYGTTGTITIWNIWNTWANSTNTGQPVYVEMPARTPEQIAAAEEFARKAREDRAAAQAKAEAAKAKSLELLRSALDRKQQQEFDKEGWFHVETRDGRHRYRLAPGRPPVRVQGEDGRRWSYCISPDGQWPVGDVTLAQKLLLEADEEQFLSTANATAVAA